MKNSFLLFVLFFSSLCSLGQTAKIQPTETIPGKTTSTPISIKWVNNLSGDFSFINNWSYPNGVALNDKGIPVCGDGGFCPERCSAMLDSNRNVLKDSIRVFYELLDTTHQFYSIQCEAWCYEWLGTDFIDVTRNNLDSTYCSTAVGIATHCSLQLGIYKDTCLAIIDLNSIVSGGSAIYYCTDGFITIEKNSWDAGIMKAEFSFNFEHLERPSQPMFWKGKIYSKIK